MQRIDDRYPLVLGSASPRRRELLAGLGLPFSVRPVSVDESVVPGEDAEGYLDRVVRMKLAASGEPSSDAAALLVADTVVVVDGDILGKPADTPDAARLLRRIVGRTHVVMTRYAVGVSPTLGRPAVERTVQSRVHMRDATDAEIERYAATGEGLDKAGAYAAQGIGAFLVRGIEGSYSNVIGLPVCEVVEDLRALDLLGPFP